MLKNRVIPFSECVHEIKRLCVLAPEGFSVPSRTGCIFNLYPTQPIRFLQVLKMNLIPKQNAFPLVTNFKGLIFKFSRVSFEAGMQKGICCSVRPKPFRSEGYSSQNRSIAAFKWGKALKDESNASCSFRNPLRNESDTLFAELSFNANLENENFMAVFYSPRIRLTYSLKR